MTRSERIQKKIQKLSAQLEFWRAELERAEKKDADDMMIFQSIPARVRNRFDDLAEFKRFIYGQHDGRGVCGCSATNYDKAKTPCERLESINGIGHATALSALKVLHIKF